MNIKLITILLLVLPFTVASQEQDYPAMDKTNTAKQISVILDNGKQKRVRVDLPADESANHQGIIVEFINQNEVDIELFEQNYQLKLEAKMAIGYYIFANDAEKTDIEITRSIIEQETNVKTVKPNWKMNQQTY